MDRTFVGRQPIYQDGVDVFAYELLSRDSELNRAAFTDRDRATARLLLGAFVDIGLDQVVGPYLAFVNVTPKFLLSDYCFSLPKSRVVLEIGADTPADPALLNRLSDLKNAGYSIALDNFPYAEAKHPLLPLASIVKIDIRGVAPKPISAETAALRKLGVKLLAQKVETHEAYDYSKQSGFDYYQGYFFCKPQIVSQRQIPSDRLSILHLLSKLQDPQITIDDLELAVGQNLAMSFRIFRYLNSPLHGLSRKVSSLRHGIALVGTRLIANWASMMLLQSVENKPLELMTTTMVRAYMCSQLGAAMRQRNVDQFFTVGLLSLIDAVVDRPMTEVLKLLPLVDDVKNAIVHRTGPMGAVLNCVEAYEQCDWDRASCKGIDDREIRQAFLNSVTWARATTEKVVA